MARVASNRPQLNDRVARRDHLRRRLAECQAEISVVSSKAYMTEQACIAAHHEVMDYEKRAKDGDVVFKESLDGAKNRLAEARRERDDTKKRLDDLNKEITAIEQELCQHDDAASIDEVLAYQKQKLDARAKVHQIQSLIEEQRAIVATAEARVKRSSDLESRHADLAAAVAEGRDSQGELDKIESAIRQEQDDAAAIAAEIKPVVNRSRQTIVGLERRLNDATAELDRLTAMDADVYSGLMWRLANETGHEYYDLARRIIAAYRRLSALDMLLREINPRAVGDQVTSSSHREFFLPNFPKLTACGEHEHKKRDFWNMFSGSNIDFVEDLNKLKTELREIGLAVEVR